MNEFIIIYFRWMEVRDLARMVGITEEEVRRWAHRETAWAGVGSAKARVELDREELHIRAVNGWLEGTGEGAIREGIRRSDGVGVHVTKMQNKEDIRRYVD